MSRVRFVVVACACALVALVGVSSARSADERNVVRFGLSWISPTGDLTMDSFAVEPIDVDTRLEVSGTLTLEADDAVGFAVAYERLLNDRFGVEFGLLGANHDVRGRLVGVAQVIRNADNVVLDEFAVDEEDTVGDVDVAPWTAGILVHLSPKARVDAFVGGGLAYVVYGDFNVDGGGSFALEDELTWHAVIGIDVPIGDGRWGFHAAARYLETQAEPSDAEGDSTPLDVNPYIVQAGAAYRF